MSILDNEGHDPQGLGNTLSRDARYIFELRAEIKRLRTALQQVAIDCDKVLNDEICSEAERRTWRAVGRFALAAAKPR